MFEVVVRSHFDAAHFLRDYVGKCAQIHGHRWDVEVCIAGSDLSKNGMLIDFGDIKKNLNNIINEFDHHLLNDLSFFSLEKLNPTAENLAFIIYSKLKKTIMLKNNTQISWVKVYESPDSWAIFKED